jgi:hypothetical protein
MTTLHIELAKEEAGMLQQGEMLPHETSPSMFVQIGLDLEEQQCVPQPR